MKRGERVRTRQREIGRDGQRAETLLPLTHSSLDEESKGAVESLSSAKQRPEKEVKARPEKPRFFCRRRK